MTFQLDSATNLTNIIFLSTQHVLQTMANTQSVLQTVDAPAEPLTASALAGDISAVVGMMSQQNQSILVFIFPMSLTQLLVARMLNIPPQQITPIECCDGAKELANMIAGHAKTTLAETTQTAYRLSLPSILTGAGQTLPDPLQQLPCQILTIEVEGQTFYIRLCLNTSPPERQDAES